MIRSTGECKRPLLAAVLLFTLVFMACTPRLAGEGKAKEAGLALINQVFDVKETDAVVTYVEYAGFSYVNGVPVQYGTEEPVRVYTVAIPQNNSENPLYCALVNAETGFAYQVEKGEDLFSPMSAEQQNQAEELASIDLMNGDYDQLSDAYRRILNESNPGGVATDWATKKFCPGMPVIATLENCSMTDSEIEPRVYLEYLIVFMDGAVYRVTLVWPTMEVKQVSILSRSVQ